MIYILYVAYYLNGGDIPTSVQTLGQYETHQECLTAKKDFEKTNKEKVELLCSKE